MVLLGWRPSELWSRNSTTCWPSGVASRMRAIGAKRLPFSAVADKGSSTRPSKSADARPAYAPRTDVGAKRTARFPAPSQARRAPWPRLALIVSHAVAGHILAIDQGTTGTTALVMGLDGATLGRRTC